MSLHATVSRSAVSLLLVLAGLAGGCRAARSVSADGHWAQEAAAVAEARLLAARMADGNCVRSKGGSASGAWGTSGLAAGLSRTCGGHGLEDEPSAAPTWAGSIAGGPDEILAAVLPDAEDGATTAPVDGETESLSTQQAVQRGPLPSFRETVKRDVKRAPGELWRDTKRVYTNVPNLVILGMAGAASIALRPEVDGDIGRHYDHHHTFSHDWRDAFGALGNPGTHFAVAGAMYLIGEQLPHDKTYEVGRTLFSALTINGLSTIFLQAAAWDKAPNGEMWGWPSGHTSSTMTMAAVMHQAYGPLAGAPLYGLATLVAIERLDDREHWFSDVIFGGALGWVIGHTVAGGRLPEINGGQIVPYVDPVTGFAGVAWWKSL